MSSIAAKTGLVAWFCGLSGAGKSTIAALAKAALEAEGVGVLIIDGDDLRLAAGRPLGFSPEDLAESNRLAIEACANRRGESEVLLVTRISPLAEGRKAARERLGGEFCEVYVKASLEAVRRRDPKGLYARPGTAVPMVGSSDGPPFDAPRSPDLLLDTEGEEAPALARRLADFLRSRMGGSRP